MRHVVLLPVLLSLAFAPAPFPKAQRNAKAAGIEGLWRSKYDLLVTADRLTYNPGSPQPYAYELRLDEAARPRAFSTRIPPGSSFDGNGALGIYKVEGDTLTISYNPDYAGRPTAFSGPGRGMHTEVYKRVR